MVCFINVNDYLVLVEFWIDCGDVYLMLEMVDVLFLIMLLLFCMEFGKDQSFCIVFIYDQLFVDCELLFWFNVFEVLLKLIGLQVVQNLLQFVLCLCLKLFYWFEGLVGDLLKVFEVLIWKVVVDGKGYVLQVYNLMFYFVMIFEVLVVGGSKLLMVDVGMIVLQFDLCLFLYNVLYKFVVGVMVVFMIINDFGGVMVFKGMFFL